MNSPHPSPAPKTLLIVDDDPSVLALAAMVLGQSGYRCLKADHGAEALRILAEAQETLALITDIRMPGMTGIDLGHAIRRDGRDFPILLMSGFSGADKDESLGLLLQPKVAFLPKPFTPSQLTKAVADLLAP